MSDPGGEEEEEEEEEEDDEGGEEYAFFDAGEGVAFGGSGDIDGASGVVEDSRELIAYAGCSTSNEEDFVSLR